MSFTQLRRPPVARSRRRVLPQRQLQRIVPLPLPPAPVVTLFTSAIDPTKPVYGNPTTQSVRDNFAAAKGEIEALQAGQIADAPFDANTYGRHAGTWTSALALSGGTMTGALTLAADPTVALSAATKQYADKMLPLSGGTLTGPLNYTATGGNTVRSAQDRAADIHNALDLGVVCDGVTDSGAALNAALQAIPSGATLMVPASVYTSQTILVNGGRRLVTQTQGAIVVNPGASQIIRNTVEIIGANALSPVVMIQGDEAGMEMLAVTRNGTPPAGVIGILCDNGNQMTLRRVSSYNHATCIQIGRTRSLGLTGAVNTRLYDCVTWNCITDHVYLIHCPEVTFINHRFGRNGSVDPICTSLLHIDGENDTTTGTTTNTVTCLRCQFNPSGNFSDGVLWTNFGSANGIFLFQDCYGFSGSTGFLVADSTCTNVLEVMMCQCAIGGMALQLISDPSHAFSYLQLIGNNFVPNLTLTANNTVAIVGNVWVGGGPTVTLSGLNGGCFTGNTCPSLVLSGNFFNNYTVAGNGCRALTTTAAGSITIENAHAFPAGVLTVGADALAAWPTLNIDAAAGQRRQLTFQTASSPRWTVQTDNSAEGGSNSGSNFAITAAADNGAALYNPLAIQRSTGVVTMAQGAAITGGTFSGTIAGSPTYSGQANFSSPAPNAIFMSAGGGIQLGNNSTAVETRVTFNTVAGQNRDLAFMTAGAWRWWVGANNTAEPGAGSNGGSDFGINCFTDAGTPLFSPILITRSTGAVTFGGVAGQISLTSGGPTIRAGTGAATGTQPAGSVWLRTDGAVGTRLYVSAGGGTWNAVAGV